MKPESCLAYQRGPGTCASLHQAVFYSLHTSYLLSLFTKRPQAYKKNAFKSFTVFCYLVRKFHFFSRQKTKHKQMNSLTLFSNISLVQDWSLTFLIYWSLKILIQFIFLSSCQSSLFQPFLPHRSSKSFPFMNCCPYSKHSNIISLGRNSSLKSQI